MVLYHKWDVKNDFAYMLQFFSLIFDGLGSVIMLQMELPSDNTATVADYFNWIEIASFKSR